MQVVCSDFARLTTVAWPSAGSGIWAKLVARNEINKLIKQGASTAETLEDGLGALGGRLQGYGPMVLIRGFDYWGGRGTELSTYGSKLYFKLI